MNQPFFPLSSRLVDLIGTYFAGRDVALLRGARCVACNSSELDLVGLSEPGAHPLAHGVVGF
jgi:hypothetical protein